MPIYEYRCNACGVEKEHLQKMKDAPITTCPVCASNDYIKLISAVGFKLKGSGWYETDFKNKPSKEAKPKPASDKKTTSDTTTKPATSNTTTTTSTKSAATGS